MLPDIDNLEGFTTWTTLLGSTAVFIGVPEVDAVFSADPSQITVGEYSDLLDAAEQALAETDFSFLETLIAELPALLEASVPPDSFPDDFDLQQLIDEAVALLEDLLAEQDNILSRGFAELRDYLSNFARDTILADALGFDLSSGLPIEIPSFDDLLPEGWASGDPHLSTLDGFNYDFQAAGEYVLAQSTDGQGFIVQARMVPVTENLSVISAVATELDGIPVMIDATDAQPVSIDGTATALADGSLLSVGNGVIQREGNTYSVIYPGTDGVVNEDDSKITVQLYEDRLDLLVQPAETLLGNLEGLLGDGDGRIHLPRVEAAPDARLQRPRDPALSPRRVTDGAPRRPEGPARGGRRDPRLPGDLRGLR